MRKSKIANSTKNVKNSVLAAVTAALLFAGSFGASAMPVWAGETGDDSAAAQPSHKVVGGYIPMPSKVTNAQTLKNIHFRDIEKDLVDEGKDEKPLLRRGAGIPSAFPTGGYLNQDTVLEYLTTHFPATRNQSPFGTCWAVSAVTLAEFYNICHGYVESGKETETDYSEFHLAYWTYTNGTGKTLNTGGADDTFVLNIDNLIEKLEFGGDVMMGGGGTLFRERGPVLESTLPYPVPPDSVTNYEELVTWSESVTPAPETERGYNIGMIKDAILVPWDIENKSPVVKEAIMENGAISVTMDFRLINGGLSDPDFYDSEHNAYYIPAGTSDAEVNHAVVLVGWDDDFPKEYFPTEAPGDGAWIVRNSWTTDSRWIDDSYFWISYYDAVLSMESAVAYVMDDPEKSYDNNYYYDGEFHFTSNLRFPEDSTSQNRCANVFTACGDTGREEISAVRFAYCSDLPEGGLDYTVNVYRGATTEGGLNLGALCSSTAGKLNAMGIFTIPLREPVMVTAGQNFAVEVVLEGANSLEFEAWAPGITGSGRYDIAVCPGESWAFLPSENRWCDITEDVFTGLLLAPDETISDKSSALEAGYGNAVISVCSIDREPAPKHKKRSSGSSAATASDSAAGETAGEQAETKNTAEQVTNPEAEAELPGGVTEGKTVTFKDVPAGNWAEKAINNVAKLGIFKGIAKDKFAPDDSMSRGMLSKAFCNIADGTENPESAMKDAAGKWYAGSSAWAGAAGIMQGDGKNFNGDAPIDREQLGTGFFRLAIFQGKVKESDVEADDSVLAAFSDGKEISGFARKALTWCVKSGLMKGMGGKINPKGNATRAQVSVMTDRYLAL